MLLSGLLYPLVVLKTYVFQILLLQTIIIAADHDFAGIKAATQAAEFWASTGRTVKIALPPKDCDFNDVLMGVVS